MTNSFRWEISAVLVLCITGIWGPYIFCLSFQPLPRGNHGNLATSVCNSVILFGSSDSAAPSPPLPTQPTDAEGDRAQQPHSTILSHQCQFCSKTFASRNAIFRHIRTDPTCSVLASDGGSMSRQPDTLVRQTVAFKIAYYSDRKIDASDAQDAADSVRERSEAERSGALLREAALEAFHSCVVDEVGDDCSGTVKLMSSTQTSVASQRHRALSQESGVAAAGDVVTISFAAPEAAAKGDTRREFLSNLMERTRVNLEEKQNDDEACLRVEVLACKWLPADQRFHAERSCTQRAYHYLLPLRWLPDGEELERWWLQDNSSTDEEMVGAEDLVGGQHRHVNKFMSEPPSDSLRTFADALKSAESVTVPNRRVRRKALQSQGETSDCPADTRFRDRRSTDAIKTAKGRYGLLAKKERRVWHNFADPLLRGDASPNQGAVWRCVDRCRINGFFKRRTTGCDGEEEVIALVEFRGDDFVREQVRRIVGTALAISHGWLPSDMFDVATKEHSVVETPLAPSGRLYFAEARFHFEEVSTGKGVFDAVHNDVVGGDIQSSSPNAGAIWLQEKLLENKSSTLSAKEEDKWLWDVRDTIAPRIKAKLRADLAAQRKFGKELFEPGLESLAPPEFSRTISLLRGVTASGAWPETSVARSNVIRCEDIQTRSRTGHSGSFTVVNPKFLGGVYSRGIGSDRLPQGNALFPDLVDSVFELEEVLSRSDIDRADESGAVNSPARSVSYRRPSSSHCAINANAQFQPHVDSGRGAGQSLSMIVGLGDYARGELFVEGASHDIRYRPLEFDGWACRHWTDFYQGERFSLVWFTPEVKGITQESDSPTLNDHN